MLLAGILRIQKDFR